MLYCQPMSFQLSKPLRLFLKITVTIAISGYLFWLIYSRKEEYHLLIQKCLQIERQDLLLVLGGLIFVNWSFETLKWKVLTRPIEQLSFLKSYESVLVGLSMGLITPRSIGDYVGRLLLVKSPKKHELLGSLLLSRVNQMVVTLLFGLLGVFGFVSRFGRNLPFQYPLAIGALISILILFALRKQILNKLFATSLGAKIKKYLFIIRNYPLKDLFAVFVYSVARYLVFTFQYLLFLKLLGVHMHTIDLLIIISITFLVKSMMFSVNFLTDMGVRQLTAVGIMAMVKIPESVAVMGSFGLWGMNILIPSIIGLVLLMKVKWRLGV